MEERWIRSEIIDILFLTLIKV